MLNKLFTAVSCLLFLVCQSAFAQTPVAPVPAASKGVMVDQQKGYYSEKIGDGLYWVTDGFYTSMFLVTGKGVIVVDAPPTTGDKMLRAIKEVTSEPITHVVYTHSHADHVGGAWVYPKSAVYIAHKETAERLKLIGDPSRVAPYGAFVGGKPIPLPTVTFDKSYTLKVGKQILQLDYHGDDHEPGNIYVYAPKQKVLMQIDVIFPGWTPFKGLAIAENVVGFLKAHDRILSYDFDKMVTGHWNKIATRKDVEIQRDYMRDIQTNAATALKTVDFYAIAKETGMENIALLFETYLKAVSQKCNDLTVPKWKDKLAGVDVWTYGHCYEVAMSQRVD